MKTSEASPGRMEWLVARVVVSGSKYLLLGFFVWSALRIGSLAESSFAPRTILDGIAMTYFALGSIVLVVVFGTQFVCWICWALNYEPAGDPKTPSGNV